MCGSNVSLLHLKKTKNNQVAILKLQQQIYKQKELTERNCLTPQGCPCMSTHEKSWVNQRFYLVLHLIYWTAIAKIV
ncbi:uncharacterized protein LOC143239804 [Tachypleus tridentatus]|uniref:uncharacterized protein LOC143239804 n=1 Tax=Tachypleus tridentatus TaxID=6853 RepID=UPI003FD3D638